MGYRKAVLLRLDIWDDDSVLSITIVLSTHQQSLEAKQHSLFRLRPLSPFAMEPYLPSGMNAYPVVASVLQPAPPGAFAPNPAIAPSTLAAMSAPSSGVYSTMPTQESMLKAVDSLKFFLATAPSVFDQGPYDAGDPVAKEERCLNRFQLPTGELISCVNWNGLYHVRCPSLISPSHADADYRADHGDGYRSGASLSVRGLRQACPQSEEVRGRHL